ncbi:hypothetical protein NT6N_33090 [Oceaniferula spumae]|uniref:BIG2 domain-containing protein n=1 Tax=Oceaniferula spumae TaxID=2979115 RepID=A0AAT9FQU2_9BACT
MRATYYILLGLLISLMNTSCQTHLKRYVTVYDQAKQPIKTEVVFQTFDWNNSLGVMNNSGTVAVTNSRGPVKVKIPNHKEIRVGLDKQDAVQNPSAKIRFKGEGDLELYKPLHLIVNRSATKSKPSGYSILISKDPQKTWRDFREP